MNAKAYDVLNGIVENGIDVHRCAAVRALARLETPSPVKALTGALLDEDPDVRTDAAAALGQVGDASCAEALMENLLGDPESDVKKEALAALVSFGYTPVIPLLRQLVTHRSSEISWDEDEYYNDGWDSWLDLQILAIRALGQFADQEAVPQILAAMADEEGQDVTEVGVTALALMGENGAGALFDLYRSASVQLCRRIAKAVANSGNPHLAPLVDVLLQDASARVREITALGLRAEDIRLMPLFADPDSVVRGSVVSHVGSRLPQQTLSLIEDPDPTVRANVFKVIAAHPGDFTGEDIATSVRTGIAGNPEAAKQAALAWIALKGPAGIKGLSHAMTNTGIPLDFRVGVIEALTKAGPVSVPHLLKAAGDDDRQMRLTALTALVDFAADDPVWPNPAGEGLLAALDGALVTQPEQEEETPAQDPVEDFDPAAEEEQREVDETLPLTLEATGEQATSTLDVILSGGTRAKEPPKEESPEEIELSEQHSRLLELSKQRAMSKRKMSLTSEVAPYLDVRRFAAQLLGGVQNPEVTEVLIAALDEEDSEISAGALVSLVQHAEKSGTLPEAARASLLQILQDQDQESETRVLAVRALARIQGDKIDDLLHDLLNNADDLIRVEAVRGLDLRGIADQDVEHCLGDSYPGVGIAASVSLARNRGDQAVDALISFALAHDGTYRRDIGRLLASHARESGLGRLIALLENEEQRRNWLVGLDALAEVLGTPEKPEELKVA